jgi:hypothetical protein
MSELPGPTRFDTIRSLREGDLWSSERSLIDGVSAHSVSSRP